ncbi:MAG: tetratricopeptide repeat protein [Patescibacteria group bacterium]
MILLIPLILCGLSILTIVVICLSKIPKLRVIDVSSIAQERTRLLKEKIIMEKFQRAGQAKVRLVTSVFSATAKAASRTGRRAVQKLYAVEQYYQKLNRAASEGQHAYTHDVLKRMGDEAKALIRKEEYIPAEKIFIDMISHNPKSVEAYEGLGNLYLQKEEFTQARETLLFTLRLSPNDASVNASLAELEMKLGNDRAALDYLRKAVGKRSKNPKYLDFFTEAALRVGSLKDARTGLVQLKKVNPENQKIQEFEARFQELKEEYISKTNTTDDTSSQSE